MNFLCLLSFCFLIIFNTAVATAASGDENEDGHPRLVRISSFNIWHSGANVTKGLEKVAKHIQLLDPEVLSVQEVTNATFFDQLMGVLSSPWEGIAHSDALLNLSKPAIITKHKLLRDSCFEVDRAVGCGVQLPNNATINFISVHLDYRSFGPYAAWNRLVTKVEQIMAGERNRKGDARMNNMDELVAHSQFNEWLKEAGNVPLVVAGDFNSASHFDWIEETKEEHGGWVFEWPATKLMDTLGFTDTYRSLHPNVTSHPGHTWSPVAKSFGPDWDYSFAEPQDRIDYIFYIKNHLIKPLNCSIYSGDPNAKLSFIPDHFHNDYPSDHCALSATFELNQ